MNRREVLRTMAAAAAVAGAAGLDRFAYCGFSFGAGVGLQLAARTDRLTALQCGSWSPIGCLPDDVVALRGRAHLVPAPGGRRRRRRSYLQRRTTHITDLVRSHREDLGNLGWEMRIVPGFGHELGSVAQTAAPIGRQFLDRVL